MQKWMLDRRIAEEIHNCKQFYDTFPEIFHALRGKSFIQNLTWTHFRILLQVEDTKAREWYLNETPNIFFVFFW